MDLAFRLDHAAPADSATGVRPAPVLQTQIISSAEGLSLLHREWDELAARAPCHASATLAWAEAGWETVASPRGADLRVILIRQAGRLAAVWPLVRYRQGRASVLMPLGSESSEYSDILAEAGSHDLRVGRAAWQAATGLGDVLILRHVRHGSLLDRVVRTCGRPTTRHTIPAPWICFERHPDFGAYLAGVSKHHRANLRRRRQSLTRLGALEFSEVEASEERAEILDWVLACKQEWLGRKGLRSVWIDTPEYHAFLHRVATRTDRGAWVRVFTLRLDGKLIAALLGTIDQTRFEFYLTGYDAAWARLSPGAILLADCIEWAYANGLNFDFRIGDESYKSIWANRTADVTTFHVALTAIGIVPVALEAARLSPDYGRRLLRPWRRRVMRWLSDLDVRRNAYPRR